MSKVLDYLNRVDSDAKFKTKHEQDPRGTMKSFGLSDDECDALLSGDSERICRECGIEKEEFNLYQVPHVTYE